LAPLLKSVEPAPTPAAGRPILQDVHHVSQVAQGPVLWPAHRHPDRGTAGHAGAAAEARQGQAGRLHHRRAGGRVLRAAHHRCTLLCWRLQITQQPVSRQNQGPGRPGRQAAAARGPVRPALLQPLCRRVLRLLPDGRAHGPAGLGPLPVRHWPQRGRHEAQRPQIAAGRRPGAFPDLSSSR
uniref:Secreted protein n=1 Tax=Macrostomum lignano TaxID=282301 RepID=A0A1I8HW56_9PLAT